MELRIARINGGEVLGSRGNPTVEAEVTLANRNVGQALVPSGASLDFLEGRTLPGVAALSDR